MDSAAQVRNNAPSLAALILSFYLLLLLRLDDDECRLGSNSCEHTCQDIQGFYTCSCREGYVLDTDGQTCNGIDRAISATYVLNCKDDLLNLQRM